MAITILYILLMCVIAIENCEESISSRPPCGDIVVYVDEQNGQDQEPENCTQITYYRTLAQALACTACCNSTTVQLLGNVTLNTSIYWEVRNRKNLAIIGTGWNTSFVMCGWEFNIFDNSSIGAGFSFYFAKNFTISDLTMKSCGLIPVQKNGTIDYNLPFRLAILFWQCTDITVTNVHIESSNGIALGLFNIKGTVNILNSAFLRNRIWSKFPEYVNGTSERFLIHGGGGIHIFIKHRYTRSSAINIKDCTLAKNSKKKTSSKYESAETGGGLLIYFSNKTRGITVNISRCTISQNKARWGGGVFIGIVRSASQNKIYVLNSTIEKNTVSRQHGGGGIDLGLFYFNNKYPPKENTIEINNTLINQNMASYGGGTTIYSDSSFSRASLHNKVQFSNCTWINNTAQFGAAIDIGPNVFDEAPNSILLRPIFINCTFRNNSINSQLHKFDKGKQTNTFSSAIVSITSINAIFSQTTKFIDNKGTALMVNSAVGIFESESTVMFIRNKGTKGGAINLLGISFIQFGPNSYFYFEGNNADIGGAIYSLSSNQHDYLLTRSCFLKYFNNERRGVDMRNTTFKFVNNIADSTIGNSIFVSTLIPCNHSCYYSTAGNHTAADHSPESIFNHCIGKFVFHPPQQKNIINTMGYKFNSTTKVKIRAFPGQKIRLNPTILDETKSRVNKISVFKVTTLPGSDVMIPNNSKYTVMGDVKITGKENHNGSIQIQTTDYRAVIMQYNITLTRCPPGYTNPDQQECKCQQEKFFAIHCNPSNNDAEKFSYITYQAWAGQTEDGRILSSTCPIGYCTGLRYEFGFTKLTLIDVERGSICANGREGMLCGQCIKGTSVRYHSREYECLKNKHCKLGILLFVMTELVPVTIIFILALFFNINFTSGALNGFILFAQVVQLYDNNDYAFSPKFKYVLKVQRVFYGIFDLNMDWRNYCLWQGATTLDILAVKYITIIYSFLLVLCLVFLLNRCTYHRLDRACNYTGRRENNLMHGLTAFFVVCYSQCAKITFSILRPGIIWQYGPKQYKDTVVYLNGNLAFFGKEHIKYAIPAILFLITFVLLPPIILLFNSFASMVISVCTNRGYNLSTRITNKLLMVRLKPLLDTFQGCFNDSHRYFAGMYFLYRIMLYSINIFSKTETLFYVLSELFLIVISTLHGISQPYKEKWHNRLDTLFFTNLMILNGITFYTYTNSNIFRWNFLRTTLRTNMLLYIESILLYLPIVYVIGYAVFRAIKRIRLGRQSSSMDNSLSLEWPQRLVRDDYETSQTTYGSFQKSQ